MKSMNLNLNVIFVLWTLAESLHALVVFVLVPIARAMISTIFLTDYNSGCDLGSDGKDDMESELRDVEADRQKLGCSIYHLKQLSQWGKDLHRSGNKDAAAH